MKENICARRHLTLLLALGALGSSALAQTSVKVGILHSLTGTMAISKITVANAAQLAVDEVNASGGVMGKKIEVAKQDGYSDWPTFATKAEKLLTQDRVATVGHGTGARRHRLAAADTVRVGPDCHPRQ
ncbi:transporter substrate-binding protein [Deinococcus sp. SM5_A1]|uniref:transporter substrate-binding protein n=1 Tax=Deinococcus sp. SM5_A1 TaxID=3379094 RepID=UPI00385C38D8